MEEWVNFIANTGFPIFITIYLLVRLEKVMGSVMNSLEDLKDALHK